MADLIDRDKALSVFIERDGDDDFMTGYNVAVNEYRLKIAHLPTVNPWILCSERLPEKQGLYLVLSESRQMQVRSFLFSLTCGAEPYFSGCEKIVAWAPLPEYPENIISDKTRCEKCFRFRRWNGNPCCSGFGIIDDDKMKKGCSAFLDCAEVNGGD